MGPWINVTVLQGSSELKVRLTILENKAEEQKSIQFINKQLW